MLWLAEEEYRRKEFNISLMSDKMLKKLRHCNMGDKSLDTYDFAATNYHCLSNPEYQQRFGYAPAGLKFNLKSSYLINLALFGAYVDPVDRRR